VTENESWSQERAGFRVSSVHLVGGGDVPSTGSGRVGVPDILHGRSCRRAQPAVVVNPAKFLSGRLTFKWAVSDYAIVLSLNRYSVLMRGKELPVGAVEACVSQGDSPILSTCLTS
jgi:hypothetical protein